MEPPNPTPSVFILPHPGNGTFPADADSFAGLNSVERAAHAEMLHRAFSIWECRGRPVNSQLSDWLEAETEVLRESHLAGH